MRRRAAGRGHLWRGSVRAVAAGGFLILAASRPAVALPPPADSVSYGAAGTGRNGFGGEIAPSATTASWPGTGLGANGGPFAFVGAQYGSLWGLPTGPNNSRGVGYCVMEDVTGTGRVRRQPDPVQWDTGEMARAAALMATFGGDRVVPYGIDASGSYDVATGEWRHPALGGAATVTRRRQVAVNFGVRMFLEDVSPTGVVAGRKLARDTSVVNGSRGDFAALRSGYTVAQRLAEVADRQHAVEGLRLSMVWGTPSGESPAEPGVYPLEVRVTDGVGKQVGFVPVLQLSSVGLQGNRSRNAVARVDDRRDTADDRARADAARGTGWPDWEMQRRLVDDERLAVSDRGDAADVTDSSGIARFRIEITDETWELAFYAQAPTADVELHAGTGLQGQVTWAGGAQSATIHEAHRPPSPPTTTTTAPPTTTTTVPPPPTPPPPPTTTTPTTTTTSTVPPPPPPTTPTTTTTSTVPPPPTTTSSTTTTSPLAPTTTSSTIPPPVPSTEVPTTIGPRRSATPPRATPPRATTSRPTPPQTLPRTGSDLTGRAADIATILLTAGLVVFAVAGRPVERRRREH